jgi:hypothetical protein
MIDKKEFSITIFGFNLLTITFSVEAVYAEFEDKIIDSNTALINGKNKITDSNAALIENK